MSIGILNLHVSELPGPTERPAKRKPQRKPIAKPASLTERQQAIMREMRAGRTLKEIGVALHYSKQTVDVEVYRIRKYYKALTNEQAMACWIESGQQ